MYDFKFAKTIIPLHTNDVNEALLFTENLKIEAEPSLIRNLTMNDDGTITYNGEPKKITKYGFESFCRKLGIPTAFARKIPGDLLLNNIRRLSEVY